ncbi:MAG: hypothetical protein V1822_03490 [Candidatus Micrarchaeota archaeon]
MMVQIQNWGTKYISNTDAKKVFSAYRKGYGYDEFRRLTTIVADKTGRGNLPISVIEEKALEVWQKISIDGENKPTNAKKFGYITGFAATALFTAPIVVPIVKYIQYHDTYRGIDASEVGYFAVLVSAAYGVYKAARTLASSWRAEMENARGRFAFGLEQKILEVLPKQ